MEAFLNFLWVLIAAAALGFWRTRWQREQREARRDPLREWTAIGCALVLLFFAVSLSDDLHSEAILSDGCATFRTHAAWSCHAGHRGNDLHAPAPAVLASLSSIPKLRETDPVVIYSQRLNWFFPVHVFSGRAPPESSL
jgi:hypothetical protein